MNFKIPTFKNQLVIALCFFLLIFNSCSKENATGHKSGEAIEVTTIEVAPSSIPIEYEFIAQTESSRLVEIRSRVDGFLEKRVYNEGDLVKEGDVMFLMDKKPFEATLQQAKGELSQQEARLINAQATLNRIKPLAEKNAMSKKDLDDAIANEQSAKAAVITAQGKLKQAELNLSYTTITSPVTGISSKARKQEGSYISATDNLLTTVSQLDPIYINFSVSEYDMLRLNDDIKSGSIVFPKRDKVFVEIKLADGKIFPYKGNVNFAEPSYNTETGTFMVRAEVKNPKGDLRPGQFVRVKILGVYKPNSIIVPQRAVLQTAQGNIVFVVDGQSKAQVRPVRTGELIGDKWLIKEGLRGGDKVVVDGVIKLSPGIPVKAIPFQQQQDPQPAKTNK
ncbi:MAG: efflux RND transporter periplasmic adaptor subunit [Thermodesulfovibrionales bacterium]|nr:efflux RND transporter periplasmic adaptor subunit [Thermodesulfovibrionales bacterium]